MNRITLWSRWLGRFARIWLVGGPLLTLGVWIALPWFPEFLREALAAELPTVVTWRVQALGFLSELPKAILHVLLFLQLIKLFDLWQRGTILDDANVTCFRRMGSLYLIATLVGILMQPVRALASSIENPPGQRTISLGLSSDDARAVFLSLFLFLLAYVMDQGRKYRQESELTI